MTFTFKAGMIIQPSAFTLEFPYMGWPTVAWVLLLSLLSDLTWPPGQGPGATAFSLEKVMFTSFCLCDATLLQELPLSTNHWEISLISNVKCSCPGEWRARTRRTCSQKSHPTDQKQMFGPCNKVQCHIGSLETLGKQDRLKQCVRKATGKAANQEGLQIA